MYACLSTSQLWVLINGSPAREFKVARGIHQGDSLSPFLLNIAIKGLAILFHCASEVGLFEGLQLRCGEFFTHLQYAIFIHGKVNPLMVWIMFWSQN